MGITDKRKLIEQSTVMRPTRPTLQSLTDSMLEDEPEVVERIVEVSNPNALIPVEGGYIFKRFALSSIGLEMPADMTQDEWLELGDVIRKLESSISWVVGDWAAFANEVWGVAYQQIAERFGYEEDTIKSYASVCRAIPRLIRNQPLSFAHHRLVAKLDKKEQRRWLTRAVENEWTVAEMKRAMNPTTLPSGDTPMDEFSRALMPFYKRAKALASGVGEGERRQMADWLRELADKLENE